MGKITVTAFRLIAANGYELSYMYLALSGSINEY